MTPTPGLNFLHWPITGSRWRRKLKKVDDHSLVVTYAFDSKAASAPAQHGTNYLARIYLIGAGRLWVGALQCTPL